MNGKKMMTKVFCLMMVLMLSVGFASAEIDQDDGYGDITINVFHDDTEEELSDVQVTINNVDFHKTHVLSGTGPFEFEDVEWGKYIVLVKKEGYETEENSFELKQGELKVKDIYLEPLDDLDDNEFVMHAIVDVYDDETGDRVSGVLVKLFSEDGELIGKEYTSNAGYVVFKDLSLEEYEVVAFAEGYEKESKDFDLDDLNANKFEDEHVELWLERSYDDDDYVFDDNNYFNNKYFAIMLSEEGSADDVILATEIAQELVIEGNDLEVGFTKIYGEIDFWDMKEMIIIGIADGDVVIIEGKSIDEVQEKLVDYTIVPAVKNTGVRDIDYLSSEEEKYIDEFFDLSYYLDEEEYEGDDDLDYGREEYEKKDDTQKNEETNQNTQGRNDRDKEQNEEECEGCEYNDVCVDAGIRLTQDGRAVYCDLVGDVVSQKELNAACQNNFECLSNSCSNGVCIDLSGEIKKNTSMLQSIFSWLKGIFG